LSWVYFTDRDLGKSFPDTLAAAGLTIERHHDLFPPDGSDEEWLEHCGRNGRVAITHNHRIRYTPNQLAAVVQHKVALIVVIGKAPLPQLARNFVATLQKVEEFLAEHEPPLIEKVYRASPAELAKNAVARGSVTLWYPQRR
jgi:hypothetical protein